MLEGHRNIALGFIVLILALFGSSLFVASKELFWGSFSYLLFFGIFIIICVWLLAKKQSEIIGMQEILLGEKKKAAKIIKSLQIEMATFKSLIPKENLPPQPPKQTGTMVSLESNTFAFTKKFNKVFKDSSEVIKDVVDDILETDFEVQDSRFDVIPIFEGDEVTDVDETLPVQEM